MLQGNLLCTNFDIVVEAGMIPNITTPENPEPHDEAATFIRVFLKPYGAEVRLFSIAVPLNQTAVLNVAASLAEQLDEEHLAALKASLNAGVVLAKPGDEAKTAALLRP